MNCWKLLIVDDDKQIHEMTKLSYRKSVFQRKKFEFYSAYSALEAKDFLEKYNDIQILILDVVMESEHSGLNLVKYIREELKNNKLRIILRTGQPGFAPEEIVIDEYQINAYVPKNSSANIVLESSIKTCLRDYQYMCKLENYSKIYRLHEFLIDNNPQIVNSDHATEFDLKKILPSFFDFLNIQNSSSFFGSFKSIRIKKDGDDKQHTYEYVVPSKFSWIDPTKNSFFQSSQDRSIGSIYSSTMQDFSEDDSIFPLPEECYRFMHRYLVAQSHTDIEDHKMVFYKMEPVARLGLGKKDISIFFIYFNTIENVDIDMAYGFLYQLGQLFLRVFRMT